MKTTLEIDANVMRELKRKAAQEGRTMSEMVEAALRRLLDERPERRELPPIPTWKGGTPTVDIADWKALYDLLDEDDEGIRLLKSRRPQGSRVRR